MTTTISAFLELSPSSAGDQALMYHAQEIVARRVRDQGADDITIHLNDDFHTDDDGNVWPVVVVLATGKVAYP